MVRYTKLERTTNHAYIDHVVYDLSGYLLLSKLQRMYMDSLNTNENVPRDSEYPDNFVILRDKGGLKKVTPNFFLNFLC
jgi:hypothetical protein